tara:strand:- start:1387 stop:1989 length:603 start_codon:yes stop_codon:yes gene_type:complete
VLAFLGVAHCFLFYFIQDNLDKIDIKMIYKNAQQKPTVHHPNIKIDPKVVVLHYTETVSVFETLRALDTRKLSAHFVLNHSGSIIQLVDTEKKAWHAGPSCFRNRKNVNDFSIGIELVNPGFYKKKSFWRYGWSVRAGREWANWPSQQIKSLNELLSWIRSQHPNCKSIVGHDMIAPARKVDPGPLFPWSKLNDIRFSNY